MTYEQSINLGLIMAGIALASSVVSIAATGLLNYYLENRRRKEEKKGALLSLAGEGFALGEMSGSNPLDLEWANALEMANNMTKEAKSTTEIDFVMGFIRAMNLEALELHKEKKDLLRQLDERRVIARREKAKYEMLLAEKERLESQLATLEEE